MRHRPPIPHLLALPLLAWALSQGVRAGTEISFRAGDGRLTEECYADAQLNQASPDKPASSGKGRDLAVKHDAAGADNRVSLLAFRNLTGPGGIPPGSVIQRAILRLHCRDGGHDQDVFLVESPWEENTATWGSVPAEAARGERVATLAGLHAGQAQEVDVLRAARRWVARPESNFGLMLVSTGAGGGKAGDPAMWSSGEEREESQRPQLILVYDPPGTAESALPAPAPSKPVAATAPSAPTPAAGRAGRRVALAGDGWVARGEGAAALRTLLGTGYTVRSFGREGATVLPGPTAWAQTELAGEMAAYLPQVVVFMLGAADTRPGTREHLKDWGAACQPMVMQALQGRGLESVLLCTPVVEAADTSSGADAGLAAEQLEVQLRLVAVETNATVVDCDQAARGAAATGVPPAGAAAAAIAETILGRPPDLSLLRPAPAKAPHAESAPAARADAPAKPEGIPIPSPKRRVALVGDKPLPGEDMAALLAKELGASHEVRGFHPPSSRLFHEAGKPFSRSSLPGEVQAWHPAVVLLTLAQETGQGVSSSEAAGLEREVRAVVNTLGQLTPRPRVLLCQPFPRPDTDNGTRPDKSTAAAVERLSRTLRLPVAPAAEVAPNNRPQNPRVLAARARACAVALAAAVRDENPLPRRTP